jgi:hypothetical protein
MIFIESILHEFLDQRFAEIKSDPSLIDQIFDGMPTATIDSIKQYITNTHIKTVYHHPRDESEIPCYAIVLQSSNEATESESIGQSGDAYDEVIISDMSDGWIGSDSELLATNTDAPVTLNQFYSRFEVKDGRYSCHIKADKDVTLGKGIFIDFTNSVIQGGYTSLTQKNKLVFWIKSNRIGTFLRFGFGEAAHGEHTYSFPVTVQNLWESIEINLAGLSDSQKDRIRYMSFEIINDDSDTDVFISNLRGQTNFGSIMDEYYLNNSHRIECWSNNAELTLWLYQIALWNLWKFRAYLENSWGLMLQRIEGGDIMPQPEFYPEFLYIRGLTFNCQTIELIPRETGLVPIDVRVRKIDFSAKVTTQVR